MSSWNWSMLLQKASISPVGVEGFDRRAAIFLRRLLLSRPRPPRKGFDIAVAVCSSLLRIAAPDRCSGSKAVRRSVLVLWRRCRPLGPRIVEDYSRCWVSSLPVFIRREGERGINPHQSKE